MLIYPIGLISADEVAFAGGVFNSSNSSYYLYNSAAYWTMSPYYFSSSYAYVFLVYNNGYLLTNIVHNPHGVRPVINLRSDVQISEGNGTQNNPFKVVGAN